MIVTDIDPSEESAHPKIVIGVTVEAIDGIVVQPPWIATFCHDKFGTPARDSYYSTFRGRPDISVPVLDDLPNQIVAKFTRSHAVRTGLL